MPRGVRKTELEKLRDELTEVRATISQYKESLETMKEKEENLINLINQEEFKSISAMLEERGMSLKELKMLLDEVPLNDKQTA